MVAQRAADSAKVKRAFFCAGFAIAVAAGLDHHTGPAIQTGTAVPKSSPGDAFLLTAVATGGP